jgi:hypothetical protein
VRKSGVRRQRGLECGVLTHSRAGSVGLAGAGTGSVGYGRGRRPTAFRSTRALTESPISASSAAACAAMPRMSLPVEDSGGPGRGGVGGAPAGWAGWRSRSGRSSDARRVAGASRRAAVGSCRGAGFLRAARARGAVAAAGRFGAPDAPSRLDESPFSVARGEKEVELCAVARETRLSLRRCGRLCGSAPRTSEGRSSVNWPQSWRKPLLRAAGGPLLAKSGHQLKPPRRLRVYLQLGGAPQPLAIN